MTETTYRATDTSAEDSGRRKTINWPEQITTMKIHLQDAQADLKEIKNEIKYAMVSLAESNEKLVNSYSDNKRLHKRVDDQDETIEELKNTLTQLEKALLELKLQNQVLIDFSGGVKRVGWIAVTCGGVVVWWVLQKWLEHGR